MKKKRLVCYSQLEYSVDENTIITRNANILITCRFENFNEFFFLASSFRHLIGISLCLLLIMRYCVFSLTLFFHLVKTTCQLIWLFDQYLRYSRWYIILNTYQILLIIANNINSCIYDSLVVQIANSCCFRVFFEVALTPFLIDKFVPSAPIQVPCLKLWILPPPLVFQPQSPIISRVICTRSLPFILPLTLIQCPNFMLFTFQLHVFISVLFLSFESFIHPILTIVIPNLGCYSQSFPFS